MKFTKHTLLFFLLCISQRATAQEPFIKLADIFYTREAIVLPAGQGWVVLTGDSLRLTKFNSCGYIEWSKQYNLPSVQYGLYDFIALQNGDFGLMYRYKKNKVSITGITRLDQNGNAVWSKSYGDTNYNHYPYNLLEDSIGNIYFFGIIMDIPITDNNYSLTKVDANGNILWTKLYNFGLIEGGAIITSDQGILMKSDGRLFKADLNGTILWSKVVMTSQGSRPPIAVDDGFVFVSVNGQTWKLDFYKFDNQGNQLWGGAKGTMLGGNSPFLLKTTSGGFAGIFYKYGTNSSYLTLVEFDKDFNMLHDNSLSISGYFTGQSMCFLNDGTPIFCGKAGMDQLFIARLTKEYKSSCDMFLPQTITNTHPTFFGGISHNETPYYFNSNSETLTSDTISSNVAGACLTPKNLELGHDTAVCLDTITLHNLSTDTFDVYSWSTGETTSSISVNESGTYILHVSDYCGEFSLTDSITITKLNVVHADLGLDVVICDYNPVVLQVNTCPNCSYAWSNGSIADTAIIAEPGTYIVTVNNTDGCFGTDTVEARALRCECDVYLPNAFTPNNDTKNELFMPAFYCDLAAYQIIIFNRMGQNIFSSNNPLAAWNGKYKGKEVPEGVYLYVLAYAGIIRGVKTTTVKRNGTVAVIR